MSKDQKIKSVGLISGGLDSMVAACLVRDQGIEVFGVHFALPWGCGSLERAKESARQIGVPLKIIPAGEDFLTLLKKPRFGYGSAINPCVDCHVHMIQKAADYMRELDAQFVFTGEVLGQRPMSQLQHSMRAVEKHCGIEGLLLRPLCAQTLTPTIPEEKGWIDRAKLLKITGRGRKEQRRLAAQFGITDFPNAAGGCLLTDKNFGRRLKDLFDHGCDTLDDTIILKWGRHFRLNKKCKVILARNQQECDQLFTAAKLDDYILELDDHRGPIAVVKGENPDSMALETAAGLIQYFSRYRTDAPRMTHAYQKSSPQKTEEIPARLLADSEVESLWL